MNESIEISLKVKANNQYCCLPLLNQSSINIYNRVRENLFFHYICDLCPYFFLFCFIAKYIQRYVRVIIF